MTKVKKTIGFILLFLLALIPAACDNSVVITSTVTNPGFIGPPDKVEILYFHSPTRCGSCICFEEGITNVVNSNFTAELSSRKITYNVYDIGDGKNAALVKKYGAVSSALYLNSVKDGVDHIVNVQEIWAWNCTTDVSGFEAKVKDTIAKAIAGEK